MRTPEEIARELIEYAYHTERWTERNVDLESLIAIALRTYAYQERAAERERAAQVAEAEAEAAGRIFGEARDAAFNIAAAIRALD